MPCGILLCPHYELILSRLRVYDIAVSGIGFRDLDGYVNADPRKESYPGPAKSRSLFTFSFFRNFPRRGTGLSAPRDRTAPARPAGTV